jgi:hypothetical protein
VEPDVEHSVIYRLVYTLLFTLFVYPVLSSLAIACCLFAVILYNGLAVLAILGYFAILPIMEIFNLQLRPARFMKDKNVPKIIIRLIVLPLYPINFFFGIKDKSNFLSCDGEI